MREFPASLLLGPYLLSAVQGLSTTTHASSPSGALSRVTGPLDHTLKVTTAAICAKDLLSDAWDQITLPGPLSGCGLRLPSAMQDIALLASWDSHQKRARELCTALDRAGDHTDADAEALEAERALERKGLRVRRDKHPEMTEAARAELAPTAWSDTPHLACPGQPVRQLGAGLRILERLHACRLWTRLDATGRTRILSAGGPQTGMTWTGLPDPGMRTMPDEHWRVSTAERLGLLVCPPGIPCGLPRARNKGCCGKILDRGLRHVWHCKTGAARLRIHRSLQFTFARDLRASGGHVDVERAMPSMAIFNEDGSIEESIMDITVWWPGSTAWFGLDVTIRYAGATRYVGAQRTAGKAADIAEREKHRRYGRDVLPVAFEAGGRLGLDSMASLQRLADAAVTAAGGGRVLTRQGLVAQWRRRLEGALALRHRRCYAQRAQPQRPGSQGGHEVGCIDPSASAHRMRRRCCGGATATSACRT